MLPRLIPAIITWFLLCGILLTTLAAPASHAAEPITTSAVYLPVVSNNTHPPQPVPFGIETMTGSITRSNVRTHAGALGARWIHINTISWREVQPERDVSPEHWNWDALAVFEEELQIANELDLIPIVVVDDNPAWARIYDVRCSAIRADRFDDFALFMYALVQRYKGPPYNVRYWEIGNEVDVPLAATEEFHPFVYGCWGDVNDPYFGGRHYGDMLQVVTPAIKNADPGAQVLLGGLALLHPESPGPGQGDPQRFLEGVFVSGAADSFDILAFHSYPYYRIDRGGRNHDGDRFDDRWGHLGGTTIGKVNFLRDVMARYNVDKPLFMTEVGLLFSDSIDLPPDEYLQAQADQIIRLFARGMALDLQAICWYTLNGPGWRSSGLLDAQQNLRPGFMVFQDFIRHTQPSIDTTDVSQEYGGTVEAYRFFKNTNVHAVDVLWSHMPTTIALPASDIMVAYTRYGTVLQPLSQSDTSVEFAVNISPIYVYRW